MRKQTPKPRPQAVDSSYIQSLRYDPLSRTLWVRFTDGAIIAYLYVSPQTYKAVADADSHGEAFIHLVRDKHRFNIVKQGS